MKAPILVVGKVEYVKLPAVTLLGSTPQAFAPGPRRLRL